MRTERLGIVLLALTLAAPAWAQTSPEDEAGALYDQAVEHFSREEYDQASNLLLQAWELDPNPRLAYNVGRALDRAGRTDEALHYYLLSADAEDDDDLVARAAEAIAALHATRIGDAIVVSARDAAPELGSAREEQVAARAAADAELGTLLVDAVGMADTYVQVGDDPPRRVPAEVRLEPGDYDVSIYNEDGDTWRQRVTLASGATTRVDVSASQTVERGHGLRTAGLVTAGVGVAGIGLGVAMYGSASSSYDDAEQLGRDGQDRTGFDDAVDSGERSATLSTVAYGVGAAALATGVTLVVLDATRGGERARMTGRVSVRPGGVSVRVGF